jgi:hypothetical protein
MELSNGVLLRAKFIGTSSWLKVRQGGRSGAG